MKQNTWDPDRFRLRRLVERLIDMGEVEVHPEPVPLSRLARIIESSARAQLFLKAGPECHQLVAAVAASRARLAAAFGVPQERMREELRRRMAEPQKTFEVPSADAPVHEVVLTGGRIDLTRLPFHLQHEYDGAPYISSGVDFSRDPQTGRHNVGVRRLMLRGRDRAGVNLTGATDLRDIYLGCAERKERLALSFAIGCHPLDLMAAASRGTGDERERLATVRGAPLPMVKCLTNDLSVPADAELVLEGYLDERGYVDEEGPYGEYLGYYGPMHGDPLFHVTGITHRRDVLHHSFKHGYGLRLGECESGPMGMLQNEVQALQILARAGLDVADVQAVGASGVSHHLRVSLRKRAEDDARVAIGAVFENMTGVKHVFVTDDDIDIRSADQVEWAMSTRFQADRDIVVLRGMREWPMDPSTATPGTGAKAGFDLTCPAPRSRAVTRRVAVSPRIGTQARFRSVREALESGPMHFAGLMSALGSSDGREIVLELEALRAAGLLRRNQDGEYTVTN